MYEEKPYFGEKMDLNSLLREETTYRPPGKCPQNGVTPGDSMQWFCSPLIKSPYATRLERRLAIADGEKDCMSQPPVHTKKKLHGKEVFGTSFI